MERKNGLTEIGLDADDDKFDSRQPASSEITGPPLRRWLHLPAEIDEFRRLTGR